MTAPNPIEYQGSWMRRGLVLVPVVTDEPTDWMLPCIDCGVPSPEARCRSCRIESYKATGLSPHVGTHGRFNGHRRRGEEPCPACWVAEREYQRVRYVRRRSRK